jgi:hypothetical protein
MNSLIQKKLLHALMWLVILPWGGSSFWFWLDGVLKSSENRLGIAIGIIPYAIAYGVIGMIFCGLFTLPTYLLFLVFHKNLSQEFQSVKFQMFFIFICMIVGIGAAAYGNKLLNTGKIEFLFLVVGAFIGAWMAVFSVKIWSYKK